MDLNTITVEEFVKAAKEFIKTSDRISDGWKLNDNSDDIHKSYIRKEAFIDRHESNAGPLKAEFVIFYNLSYGVPGFSFNVWNSSGMLLSLENVRQMSLIKINKEDFYSVVTQQEHPVLFRPYFIVHPCHTSTLLTIFKDTSRNIIVTFLSLITPLIKINLPLEYGL